MAYNKDTDYSALMKDAAGKGNYTQAALYEQQRNEKIDGLGMKYDKSYDYQKYLPKYTGGYDKNTDYQALVNHSVDAGNYEAAALYEQQRNKKIEGEGLNYAQTHEYSAYLPTYDAGQTGKQVQDATNAVANIQNFSYNPETDQNWQSFQNQYVRNANRATRDTAATVAGQTGGMASSYATTAAAQAGQQYLSGLNDHYSDVYNLAMQNWQANNSAALNKLSALQGQNESAYNIYSNDRSYLANRAEQNSAADQQAFQNALAKWQAAGTLDSASAKILGIPAGTTYNEYQQFKEQLAMQWQIAQLQAYT